jgi:exosortase B
MTPSAATVDKAELSPARWLMLVAGWAAMYGPTYWDLSQTLWRTDEQFHGAIVLVVVAWLILGRRDQAVAQIAAPLGLLGGILFGLGLLAYILGRSQDILLFEVGSQIPVLAGTLLVLQGRGAVRALWFPLVYLAFMIPLPGVLVDALTGPLKQWISAIAEHLLHAAGYPIARSGVMLTIGQYQLLVADACSGLSSMISLSAMGMLYLYLVGRSSWLHNTVLLASMLPIAFGANIVRVVLLVLVTYHLGDAAGQGFMHGFAGMVLFATALLLVIGIDRALRHLVRNRSVTAGVVARGVPT